MPSIEAVEDAIYRNSYAEPDSPRIQPLHERASWEQETVRKQALAVMSLFTR